VAKLLAHFRPESSIAFCNTKQQCRDVVSELQAQGFSALALFGELEQRERDEVLVQFANKSCSVLVATDVAARGLDIADLSAVINVDVTPDPEVHIHRIGRTGRGDAEGLALNLVSMDEMGSVGKIEQLQGRASQFFPVDELTPAAGGELLPPMMTIQIIGGRKEKIRAGDVMGAMCADFGYSREQIGKISVNDFSTYVAVDRKIASAACAKLNAARSRARRSRRGCSKHSHQIDLQRFPQSAGCSQKAFSVTRRLFALGPLQPLAKNSPAITSPVATMPQRRTWAQSCAPRALPDSRPGWRPPS
jgi:ATP-independent RNA helicase DbpA